MNSIIENNFPAIKKLCKKYNVSKLYVFGSTCTPQFDNKSDIDFIVSFYNVQLLDMADTYFDLKIELEDLFNRQIDLVIEKSIKNPYLKKNIEKTKTLLYNIADN